MHFFFGNDGFFLLFGRKQVFDHLTVLVNGHTHDPCSGPAAAVGQGFGSQTIREAVLPLAPVNTAVGIVAGTDAVNFTILELADVFGTAGIQKNASSVFAVTGDALRLRQRKKKEVEDDDEKGVTHKCCGFFLPENFVNDLGRVTDGRRNAKPDRKVMAGERLFLKKISSAQILSLPRKGLWVVERG